MRTIITGSRSVARYSDLVAAIHNINLSPSAIVVSPLRTWGDQLGEIFAETQDIPIIDVCIQYNKYGDNAENVMYLDMVNNADKLLVLWGGLSNHAVRVVKMARLKGIDIHIWHVASVTHNNGIMIL
jgi:hypothetical protein